MNKRNLPQFQIKTVAIVVAMGISLPASALDWKLADRPLYLGNGVPANLMFVIDDSGSMDWEIISRDMAHDGLFTGPQPDGSSVAGDGGIKNRAGCTVGSGTFYGYAYGVEFKSNKFGNKCDVVDDFEWRFRNSAFNPFYFNPAKEYKPWAGVDDKGNAFGNVGITQAWDNVFYKNYAGNGEWIDLTSKGAMKAASTAGDNHVAQAGGFRFYTWKDDGDGKFENGEQTEYAIGSLGSVPAGWFGKTIADVQTNFANWFSYYRGRELVAKAAFGRIVSNVSGVNMGLMTLHNNAGVNTPLALIDESPAGQANRATLLRNIYRIDSSGGTPLQTAMRNAGEYLSNKNPGNGLPQKSPLPASQGGECQQNFMLAMTDGFYNGTYNDGGIGNADGDKNTKFDGGAYADKYDKTLGDIAMHYYERDIDPTNADKVPTIPGVDENPAQHVVTYTIAFGVNGTLSAMPSDPTKAFSWPDPGTSDAARVDDLRHAAYNGRGEFLAAQDPDELVGSLNYMIGRIQSRLGSSSALAFNSDSLRSNTLVFQASFHSSDWHGSLNYLPVKSDGSLGASIAEAGASLEKMAPADRVILTVDPNDKKAVSFEWAKFNSTGAWTTSLGSAAVVDYLRGSHDCEQSNTASSCASKVFRNRVADNMGWRLGDIVNSGPEYVDVPDANYTFDDYAKFFEAKKSRTPMVYIGANDGMVHGFDASVTASGKPTATTGKEKLAFIPSALAPKLKSLSDPLYVHTYTVDGSPTAADAYFGGQWHTVLVGGLRGGGQSVYALDITDPDSFAAANAEKIVLWEFTDKDDADLGYTYSRPRVAKTATGKFAAIFGNGYNNTVADGAVGSGTAALYIVNLDSTIGAKTFVKLDTGVGPASDPEGLGRPNGLSEVAVVDVDSDSIADYVYAGDLFGNMWRFDLTDADSGNWSVSFGGNPLFTAKSPEGKMQSITARPKVARGPVEPGYMVYFGTGKYLETADNATTGQPTQSFYAIRDKSAKGSADALVTIKRGNLLAQQIIDQTGTYRVTSDTAVDWNKHEGWYIDLIYKGVNGGERIITEPLLRNGLVMYTTMIPATSACEGSGSGWLMALNIDSGARLPVSAFDVNNDGTFDKNDTVTLSGPSGNVAATISGFKFRTGIPSAPAVIDSDGGLVDRVTAGTSGGQLEFPVPGPNGEVKPTGIINKLGVQGRLSWERLK